MIRSLISLIQYFYNLNNPVDVQYALKENTPDEIRKEFEDLCKKQR
jgi:hypothetical protein